LWYSTIRALPAARLTPRCRAASLHCRRPSPCLTWVCRGAPRRLLDPRCSSATPAAALASFTALCTRRTTHSSLCGARRPRGSSSTAATAAAAPPRTIVQALERVGEGGRGSRRRSSRRRAAPAAALAPPLPCGTQTGTASARAPAATWPSGAPHEYLATFDALGYGSCAAQCHAGQWGARRLPRPLVWGARALALPAAPRGPLPSASASSPFAWTRGTPPSRTATATPQRR